MKLPVHCRECSQKVGWEDASYSVAITDELVAEFECSFGHKNIALLEAAKFEILTEVAIQALVDGYFREAVSSMASALERFYEFTFRALVSINKSTSASEIDAWKLVSKQSERQLGLYIATYLQVFGNPPQVLSQKLVEYRNDVIHRGSIPSRAKAIEFTQVIVNIIQSTIKLLVVKFGDEVVSYRNTLVVQPVNGVEQAKKSMRYAVKNLFQWAGANGVVDAIPASVSIDNELRLRNIRPDTPRPLYRMESSPQRWRGAKNSRPPELFYWTFRKLRREAGLTKRGLSVELGVETSFIEAVEAGTTPIDPVIELAFFEVLRRKEHFWPARTVPEGDSHLEGVRRHLGFLISDFRAVRDGDREAATRSAKSLAVLYGDSGSALMGYEINCIGYITTVRKVQPNDDRSYTDLRSDLDLDLSEEIKAEYQEDLLSSSYWWDQPVFIVQDALVSRKRIILDVCEIFDQYWRRFEYIYETNNSPNSLSENTFNIIGELRSELIARFSWETIQTLAIYGLGIPPDARRAID